MSWTVYVLHSSRAARTYVGIALDVAVRLAQHNGKARGGARSTRGGRPWRVKKIYGPYATRSEAQRVEYAVKKLRGVERFSWREAPPAGRTRRARARRTRGVSSV